MYETDLVYYERRHAQEVSLAHAARSAAAAAAHQALAATYAEEVRRLRSRDHRLSIVAPHAAIPAQAAG